MKTALIITLLVLSASICDAQSGVGLSLSTFQTKAEKFKLIDDSKFIHSNSTVIRYLEPWQKTLVNDYGEIEDDIGSKYPTEPRLMMDFVLKVRSKDSERFFPHGYNQEDYPIKEYDGIGSLLLLLLIDNSSNSFH
jgi:hypothetical protein